MRLFIIYCRGITSNLKTKRMINMMCHQFNRAKGFCSFIVLSVLAVLFAATIGIIIGTMFASTFIENMAALIILAVVLFVLILVWLIAYLCKKSDCD